MNNENFINSETLDALESQGAQLLLDWRQNCYCFGWNVFDQIGLLCQSYSLGSKYFLVFGKHAESTGLKSHLETIMKQMGFQQIGQAPGASPNAPIDDVERIKNELLSLKNKNQSPDFVLSLGGGSLIDAVKASITCFSLGGECEDWFGVGKVSEALKLNHTSLMPHVAIMTGAASAAHLTRYSNVTNFQTIQKKLIIDPAIIPSLALFDYATTTTMTPSFTQVGIWDGIGHLSEVYWGFNEKDEQFPLLEKIVLTGIELMISSIPRVLQNPQDEIARRRIALATDLGGYAIMIGSTNGPHLNSFSLVDLMDHGMGVAIMGPYWGYFFSPEIQYKIQQLTSIYHRYGYGTNNLQSVGMNYVNAVWSLAKSMNFPTTLKEVKGFNDTYIDKMIDAAKNPQMSSKLQAMPSPLTLDEVDFFMRPVLNAAATGQLDLIKFK